MTTSTFNSSTFKTGVRLFFLATFIVLAISLALIGMNANAQDSSIGADAGTRICFGPGQVNATLFKNIQGGFDLYGINGDDEGVLLASWTDDDLDALSDALTRNRVLYEDDAYNITMYQLTSGEFQVTAGPDQYGKLYSCTFDGYSPSDNVTNSFYVGPISDS